MATSTTIGPIFRLPSFIFFSVLDFWPKYLHNSDNGSTFILYLLSFVDEFCSVICLVCCICLCNALLLVVVRIGCPNKSEILTM